MPGIAIGTVDKRRIDGYNESFRKKYLATDVKLLLQIYMKGGIHGLRPHVEQG